MDKIQKDMHKIGRIDITQIYLITLEQDYLTLDPKDIVNYSRYRVVRKPKKLRNILLKVLKLDDNFMKKLKSEKIINIITT